MYGVTKDKCDSTIQYMWFLLDLLSFKTYVSIEIAFFTISTGNIYNSYAKKLTN